MTNFCNDWARCVIARTCHTYLNTHGDALITLQPQPLPAKWLQILLGESAPILPYESSFKCNGEFNGILSDDLIVPVTQGVDESGKPFVSCKRDNGGVITFFPDSNVKTWMVSGFDDLIVSSPFVARNSIGATPQLLHAMRIHNKKLRGRGQLYAKKMLSGLSHTLRNH